MNYYRYVRGSVHRGTSNKYDDYIYTGNDLTLFLGATYIFFVVSENASVKGMLKIT